jgi:hypothetical protein
MAAAQATSSAREATRAALHKARPSPTAAALAKPVKKRDLAKTLEWLSKEPKPILERINSLELTYAYRNDHLARGMYTLLLLDQPCRPSDALYFSGCAFVCVSLISVLPYSDILQKWNFRESRTTTLLIRVDRRLKKMEEAWEPESRFEYVSLDLMILRTQIG